MTTIDRSFATKQLTADDILANAKALQPYLTEQNARIESSRRVPRDVADRLLAEGMYRISMPKSWGGPELTSMQQVEVIELLSMASPAIGWTVMIGSDSGIYSGYLEESAARQLYPRLDMIQAGWVYPVGRAVKVDGGYRVSGRWMFGSGIHNADNICGGCYLYNEDGSQILDAKGKPVWRIMVAPAKHFQILDTWHTTGMRGTGSNDYMVNDLFVPEAHSFSFDEPAQRDGVLWQANDTFLRKMVGIPLGSCRAVLEEVKSMMHGRVDYIEGTRFKNKPLVQQAVGECEIRLNAVRAHVYTSLTDQWQTLANGDKLSKAQRADVWGARLHAFQETRAIIQKLYDVVGGSAVYCEKSRLDQALRDANTWCQHIVGQQKGYQALGALLMNARPVDGFPML
ncbi:acyl-CoA dehydrogenase family protein [Salinibius halmophilus]|uniref:acyl-CoA dehydrogenase family protein n=1 Tax=Salinibius halmophilus TaxID=1853216 RepID=UPI000E6746F3|nr:acyl-CoA dehydrogenase family protein [Salinibius halmophilus]